MHVDVIDLVVADHAQLRKCLTAFDAADEATRERVALELFELLEAHARAEEDVLYPRIEQLRPDVSELVAEGVQEHHIADVLMREARALPSNSEAWLAKLNVLRENVEHHLEEEEREFLPVVVDAVDETVRQNIGADFDRRRTALELERCTVSELREIARANDIGGVSEMVKKELVDAISRLE